MRLVSLATMLSIFACFATIEAEGAREPDLVAVKFHADWCGSCKKMGSIFTDLRNKFDGKPVLFVTLDLTNVSTRGQAELMAGALGLKQVYDAHPGTGFILLVDPDSHKVLDKLTSDKNIKEVGAAISARLES